MTTRRKTASHALVASLALVATTGTTLLAQRYSGSLSFTPPPHIEETGNTQNRLFKLGFLDVTLYDGWQGHPVDPTGEKDATLALQKAIDDAYDYQLAAIFPAGTYKISDTLRVVRKNRRAFAHPNTVVGSTKGARPVIRLADNAPGFNDPDNPKPLMWIWTTSRDEERPFGTPAREYPLPYRKHGNMSFQMMICDIDFDCNGTNGNAGAAGLRFCGAQGSSIHNVKVDATDAFAGFWDIPSRSSAGAANIEVEGGRYGLYLESGCSSTIVGAVLRNQTVAALHTTQFSPPAMVGFHIEKENGPAITVQRGYNSAGGSMSLVDGTIALAHGGPAFENMLGRNWYMRNVYVTGTDELIKRKSGTITAEGSWKRIAEYAFADNNDYADGPPYEKDDTHFQGFTLIDGKASRDEFVRIQRNAPGPPVDLVSRHLWDKLPSFEDPDAVVLTEVSAADGSDDDDDADAIQAAIDKHAKVFVPKGYYRTSRTLTLRANTKLFGIGRVLARLYPHKSWQPTREAPLVQTVNDRNATTLLANINLGFRWEALLPVDWSTALHWRAGRRSMVFGISSRRKDRPNRQDRRPPKPNGNRDYRTTPRSIYRISGHGGGRWYFWGMDWGGVNEHPDYRHLLIEGTGEPLWFYGCNLEKGRGTTRAEMRNARNVRVFSIKTEASEPIFTIRDSQNVAIFSSGAMRHHCNRNRGYYQIVGSSKDVLIANINPQKVGGGSDSYTVLEDGVHGRHRIPYPGMVVLYKRGQIDDAAMCLDRLARR